jgi:putative two-component system response regulator
MKSSFPEANILVVDDQMLDVLLLTSLLEEWGYENVASTTRPSEVVGLCTHASPDLVVLDLQMPEIDGFEVLELLQPWIHAEPAMPVLVVTAFVTEEACERALAAGASDFLTKPFNYSEVALRVSNLLATRKAHMQLKRNNETLEERVVERTRELERAKLDALDRLALAGEYRDDSTQEHAQRVGRTAAQLAASLGLSAESVNIIRRAATLHDIGKLGIPDAILLKPGRLTGEEFLTMKTHTQIGFEILAGSSSELLRVAAQIALTHHEHWDGTGYPSSLADESIPIAGRLVAVADVFDALTHDRPYKHAWSITEAMGEIEHTNGTHFDPRVVQAFLDLDHEALLAPVEKPFIRSAPALAT